MSIRFKYLNFALGLAILAALSLFIKDLIIFRYSRPAQPKTALQSVNTPAERSLEDFSPILEGQRFHSATNTLTPIDIGIEAKESVDPFLLEGISLVGTMTGPRSYAIFEKKGEAKQEVFKINESVFGAGKLKEVGKDTATIEAGQGLATFTILEEEPAQGSAKLRPFPASSTPLAPMKGSGAVIDKDALLSSLDNPARILSDARLTPQLKNGSADGFLINEIKPGGVFDTVGLRNGDVLNRINGFDLKSPEQAVQVLSALRGETEIELDITRGNGKRTLRYLVR